MFVNILHFVWATTNIFMQLEICMCNIMHVSEIYKDENDLVTEEFLLLKQSDIELFFYFLYLYIGYQNI